MRYDTKRGHLEVNLKELHGIVTKLSCLGLDTVSSVTSIGLIDITMTRDQCIAWDGKLSELVILLNELDCTFHDDFGCFDGVDKP